jgi:hypothetical protein
MYEKAIKLYVVLVIEEKNIISFIIKATANQELNRKSIIYLHLVVAF